MTTAAPPQETVGELFRRRRLERGLTLEQVARDAGCAYSTLIRHELDQRGSIRKGTVAAIARVLGLTDDDLARVGVTP